MATPSSNMAAASAMEMDQSYLKILQVTLTIVTTPNYQLNQNTLAKVRIFAWQKPFF